MRGLINTLQSFPKTAKQFISVALQDKDLQYTRVERCSADSPDLQQNAGWRHRTDKGIEPTLMPVEKEAQVYNHSTKQSTVESKLSVCLAK